MRCVVGVKVAIGVVLDWLLVSMRAVVLALLVACAPPPEPAYGGGGPQDPPPSAQPMDGFTPPEIVAQPAQAGDPGKIGTLVDRMVDFKFEGGQIDFEIRQEGNRVINVARNHYIVPIMIHWDFSKLDNLEPLTQMSGVAMLPPADKPKGLGEAVEIGEMRVVDARRKFNRHIDFKARFGDPRAQATEYAYGIPWLRGLMFSVLQGFHGKFSHTGSNEYAVDFDCPVATRVIAARDGIVVAANASAQGSGTTQEYADYRRVNFVLVMHDDGTLGEYMHLAPSGVVVTPGTKVRRGQELALSGNTGFSSTPHLHFQVITAANDGIAAHSFPWVIAAAPNRNEAPVLGRAYLSWE
jgi:murein DD-endopeptidase MepM/ murein hydrolase activator NlpD